MKKLICLLLLTAVLLAGCGSAAQTPTTTESPAVTHAGASAPDFTVYDSNSNPVKLSDYLGQPVVLNFWASWCGPCKSEMPEFQKAFESYGDSIQFLMVDVGEAMADGKAFLSAAAYTFPAYFDIRSEAATAFQVSAIPATYFINADGQIVDSYVGAISESTLLAGIEAIQN